MSGATIQSQVDSVFNTQESNQFGTQRYALLFKPGSYSGFNAQIGFYTSIIGLGQNPDQVQIHGDVTVDAGWIAGNATQNFWRSAENMEVFPSAGFTRWAVAQAAPFRRMDIQGDLNLAPNGFGFATGGYIADSRITGTVQPYSQQQWFTRNSNIGGYQNGVWNMVFWVRRRTGHAVPEPAVHQRRHDPGQPGEAVPVPRRGRQLQRVRPVDADEHDRRILARRQHAGHVDAADPVLRRPPR